MPTKILVYIIITSCLTGQYFSQGLTPTESTSRKACEYFMTGFNIIQKCFNEDTLSYAPIKAITEFDKVIDTPFKGVQFYQFSFHGTEPTWYMIMYKTDNEENILDRGVSTDSGFATKELLQKINEFSISESHMSDKQILDIIQFVFYLKYYKRDGIIILTKWSDITQDSEFPVPAKIQETITPLEITNTDTVTKVNLFCWDKFSAYLSHVTVIYKNDGSLKFTVDCLGKYGMPSLTL